MSLICFVSAIGETISMFMPFPVTHGATVHFTTVSLTLLCRVQSVDDKAVFVFVDDANAHHSEWLESVSPMDRH